MKPTAIVYTSNTGFTAEYASLLGGETGLPVYALEDAKKSLPQNSPILYLGWLAAGKVQSYDKAVTNFDIQALCAVGMGKSGAKLPRLGFACFEECRPLAATTLRIAGATLGTTRRYLFS